MLVGNFLTSPQLTRDYLRVSLATEERECFKVVYLNNQHQVISSKVLFMGTIDGTTVYPREVIKEALKQNAAAVIFAHNHPSGVNEPSQADKDITVRLVEGLKYVDIRVLDHIIVTGDEAYSFAENGLV